MSKQTPCGYAFKDPRYPKQYPYLCGQRPGHAVHRGEWDGPEENHDYIPGPDRRSGSDRRALAAQETKR